VEPLQLLSKGGAEAKAEPQACERPKSDVEDGGCCGADTGHTRQIFDRIQGRDPADVRARPRFHRPSSARVETPLTFASWKPITIRITTSLLSPPVVV